MRRPSNGFLVLWGALLVFVLTAIVWTGTKLDWHLVGIQLASASLPAELAMAVIWLLALLVRPLRLLILLRALGPDNNRPYWTVWSADMIAMATNSIVPVRAGDMMMAFVLRRREGDRTASFFSVVMVDRLFDLATVMMFFVAALSWAPTIASWASDLRGTILLILAIMGFGGWLAIRLRNRMLGNVDRLLLGLSPERSTRWRDRAHDLYAGLGVLDSPRVFIPVVLLSVLFWTTTATAYWFGIVAIWPSASFAAAAFTAAAVALSFVVPLTPGGVGVFHAAAVLSLSLFGVPAEPALAFAIIFHVVQLGSVLLLALVGLVCQGISVRALAHAGESQTRV